MKVNLGLFTSIRSSFIEGMALYLLQGHEAEWQRVPLVCLWEQLWHSSTSMLFSPNGKSRSYCSFSPMTRAPRTFSPPCVLVRAVVTEFNLYYLLPVESFWIAIIRHYKGTPALRIWFLLHAY